ncbi:MAG: hypothetical protein SAL07_19660 [Oscillatoria sp. PMC 1051.18]|nr:hypothetical protein [Oscillatoria sp. PMC 1050.18]MEC5032120.1 hypothetical protein [Oscillatoria sp. PMC 1051.18]
MTQSTFIPKIALDSPESILSSELFKGIWDTPWTSAQKESLSELLKNPILHRFWCFLFDNSGEQWHQENYNFFHKLTNQPEINLDDYLPEETIKQLKGEDVPEYVLPNVKAENTRVELLEKVFETFGFQGSVDERVTELEADPNCGLEEYGDWLIQFNNIFVAIHKPSKQAWSLPIDYDYPENLAAYLTRTLLLLGSDQLKQLCREFWYLQGGKDAE